LLSKTFRYKKIYSPLNLNRLQFFVDSGRINPKEPITMFHLWRSGAIAGRIKDGVTLLGGVSSSSFFITMSFTKPRYEGHKVQTREGVAKFLFQAQLLTNFVCPIYFSWQIYKSRLSFSYFSFTKDLFLPSSCIITLCINTFATLLYDCLLVLRAVVQSYFYNNCRSSRKLIG